MFVKVLGIEGDAGVGIDAGFGDLVDLVFSQRLALLLLRGQGRGKKQAERESRESSASGIPPALLFKHSGRRREKSQAEFLAGGQ